jgi:hypothetical protein
MTNNNLTSAVPGMSVSDMRRGLAEVRTILQEQSVNNPFNMKHTLSNGVEIWKFVHLVSIGLHQKRLRNRKKDRVESDVMLSDNE